MDWFFDTKFRKLAGSLGLTYGVAFLATLLTQSSVNTWYPALSKPVFTPPGWAFGLAWTFLYTAMAVSLYLVWSSDSDSASRERGLKIYLLQLLLNGAWSGAFFALKSPMFGLAVIVPLWVAIMANILEFDRVSRKASVLLVPYLAWVSFAAALNLAIYLMN